MHRTSAHHGILSLGSTFRSGHETQMTIQTKATTLTIDSLKPQTTYIFAIQAVNDVGHSGFSNETVETLGEKVFDRCLVSAEDVRLPYRASKHHPREHQGRAASSDHRFGLPSRHHPAGFECRFGGMLSPSSPPEEVGRYDLIFDFLIIDVLHRVPVLLERAASARLGSSSGRKIQMYSSETGAGAAALYQRDEKYAVDGDGQRPRSAMSDGNGSVRTVIVSTLLAGWLLPRLDGSAGFQTAWQGDI